MLPAAFLLSLALAAQGEHAVVVPLPRDDAATPTGPVNGEIEPTHRKPGLRSRLYPLVNSTFMLSGTGSIIVSTTTLLLAGAAGSVVLGLVAFNTLQGPLTLSRGEIPLPPRPAPLGGPRTLRWNFSTSELTIAVGLCGALLGMAAAAGASTGLVLLAAGTVFPLVDLQGLGRFALRSVAFHALVTAVGLVAAASVMGTLGSALTAVLFSRGEGAARAPLPPQWGPFLLVGAGLGAAGAAVLVGAGFQLAWTSMWGPPVQ